MPLFDDLIPPSENSSFRIDPAVQAQRDQERANIIQSEFNDPQYDVATHAAIGRELSRLPVKPSAKTGMFDDLIPAKDQFGEHRSDTSIILGGVGAAGRAVAGEAAALTDMVVGLPNMWAGTYAETARRIQGLLTGESRTELSKAGREAYHQWADAAPQLFSKFVSLFTPAGEEPTETNVQAAMNAVMSMTDTDAAALEERTGGLIRKEDYQMIRDELMGLLGVKGLASSARSLATRTFGPKVGAEPIEGIRTEQQETAIPTEPETPLPSRQQTPASKAKADIEASLGIRSPAEQKAFQAQRRADVRTAFKEDPQMADYYQNYAEEEARQAEVASQQAQADMTAEAADKATPSRIGGAEGVLLDENGKPIPPATLDLALAKAVKGQLFDLTAEERLALSKAGSKWVQRDVAQQFNRGQIDADLLNILAVGGVGAALAYAYPDDAKEGLAAVAGGAFLLGDAGKIARHADKAPLSIILKDSSTTLKTLERLPQNNWKFSLDHIEQELKRADVSKAEKDVLGEVVQQQRDQGYKDISAKDLVLGFKAATHDFELTEKATDQYASYGLDEIDRLSAEDMQRNEAIDDWFPEEARAVPAPAVQELYAPKAKTSIWQLPKGMEISDANHFSDPRYFGHTRSFEENGVKHVVEIQSDLAQKAGKTLSESERSILEADIRAERSLIKQAKENIAHGVLEDVSRDVIRRAELRIVEAETKLNAKTNVESLSPILKNWEKRLVREELAATVRENTEGPSKYQQEMLQAQKDLVTLEKLKNEGGWDKIGLTSADVERQLNYAREKATTLTQGRYIPKRDAVRFATADTVAKVEGWPNYIDRATNEARQAVSAQEAAIRNPREYQTVEALQAGLKTLKANYEALLDRKEPLFAPEHQGIYDRYKKDVEKFLRQLGGKNYTDAAGHTWIEVPTQPGQARVQMFGRADPNILTKIAVVGGLAALGTSLDKDHPIRSGLLGFLSGAFLVGGGARRLGAGLKSLLKNDPRIRVDDLGNEHAYKIERAQLDMARLRNSINRLVPKEERRVAITAAIEKGSVAGLSANEVRAYRMAREFFDGVKAQALDADILEAARENYVTHLWQQEAPTVRKAIGPSMSADNRFAEHRSIPTIAKGKELGLTPLTEDIGEIAQIYGNSMARSIANKALLEGLRAARTDDGSGLVVKQLQAPTSYEVINHPQMRGYRVHPDLVPSLRFMFQEPRGLGILRAAEALNTTIKRLNVSFSLFHAKALFDAATGGFKWGPLAAVKHLAQAAFPKVFGENKYLREIREIGVGPVEDMALRGGVMFDISSVVSEDVGGGTQGNFYSGMKALQNMLDKAVPGSGVPVKLFTGLNRAFDHFMWGRLHAGMKLSLFAEKYAGLLEKYPNLPRERAAQIAASFTNDVFGGLNWRMIAENARTELGRNVALSLYSPVGRRGLQLAMFAPDWMISTTRAFTQAIKPKIGGLSAPELAKLHQGYLLRSALYYFAIGNILNYAFSHKPLSENKDWTRIDLGDGRTMQWSKHTMEVPHMLKDPAQYALNKLGYIPREGISQAFGVEYLSAHGHAPPMKEGRLAHALKSASPIGFQQFDQGVEPGVAGILGAPIYGERPEDRAVRLRQQRIQRILERRAEK